MKEPRELIATCAGGLEAVLESEIAGHGWTIIASSAGAVRFQGGDTVLEEANLMLRTASRVLVPVVSGRVSSYDEVYRLAAGVNWASLVPPHQAIGVSAFSKDNRIPDNRFLALRVKDAIVDGQRRKTGKRSDVNRQKPDISIAVHAGTDGLEISLDSSGRPLHIRGYRTESGAAPLRETVAAGIVLLSGWDGRHALVDPFCGSGTIAIEGALIALGLYPGTLREDYGFLKWPGADLAKYKAVRGKLALVTADQHRPEDAILIQASDSDESVLAIAKRNAERAGVSGSIRFEKRDFFSPWPPPSPGTVLITNPPYGERMDLADAPDFYRRVGDQLKTTFAGASAWILSANRSAMKSIGLRVKSRTPLFNGALDSRLYRIDLYRDSGSQR